MSDNDDFIMDDFLEKTPKKKKKTKQKGNRGELDIVKDLNARFESYIQGHNGVGAFSRSIGSGNRFGQQVHLSDSAANNFAGDITCPEGFQFVIESKNGYNDIDLFNIFSGVCKELDVFLKQVEGDCVHTKPLRKPLLIWKKDRKEKVAFIKLKDAKELPDTNYIFYKDWVGFNLNWLLAYSDDYFFGGK